jgi:four helix bundle protein
MQDFRKLIVWQRAQAMCVRVYTVTRDYPPEERYGLTAQLREAAVSVGSNLAEGSKRSGNADKVRIWNIALSSAAEVMSELDVAVRLEYPHRDKALPLISEYDELCGMINSLAQRVKDAAKRRARRTDADPETGTAHP